MYTYTMQEKNQISSTNTESFILNTAIRREERKI